MPPPPLPTGTVTFLFTDIEGSTRLLQELGAAYADVLAEHRRLLRAAFGARDGVEVDTQGDAFFYAFARATEAVNAARDGQEALEGAGVRVRMGLHTGEASISDGGYVGVDVHRAARICAAGHGGQVLLSDATARLVDVDLHDLGEHRLKDLSAPLRLYQLGHADFPPLRSLNFTNLPVQQNQLVGRERELDEATTLLREHRLVTLVGPGGIGKTRLALQVAAEAADDYTDGVFWIPLAQVADPELVEPAIAQAIGVTSNLANHLASKRVLFVVDNFEQVIDAAAGLARLLEAAPHLRFLVTSREPLRLSAEWEYPVPSLPRGEAIALFIARAQALEPGFEPDAAVGDICGQLDGLPLAIELAAARIKVLTPAQILERLGHRLSLLTSAARDAPARHQTLRATIDWSHSLLHPGERELFARLAVFSGGWTLAAAEGICGADVDTLEGLVSKQLVTHAGGRFGMLESIREYAHERLEDLGTRADIARRHAEFFLALAEDIAEGVRMGERRAWRQRGDEDGNFRRALGHFVQEGQSDLELRMAAALWDFWFIQGEWDETRRTLLRSLQSSQSPTVARVTVLYGAAWVSGRMGKPDEASALAEDALRIARDLGDDGLVARGLRTISVLEAWKPSHDLRRVAVLSAEAREESRSAGDLSGVAATLNNDAIDLKESGNLRGAMESSEQAVALLRQVDNRRNLSGSLLHLADAERLLGEHARARVHIAEALVMARDLGFRERVVEAIRELACLSASAGDYGWTAALLGAAQREGNFGWVPEDEAWAREVEEAHVSAQSALGGDQFEKAVAAGRAMSLDTIADYLESDATSLVPVDPEAALSLLQAMSTVRLSEFAVVGTYLRFGEPDRQALADTRQRIVMGLQRPGHRRNAHLIWAAPGTGKTYFVQQVAASMPGTAYRELNLAKSDEAGMKGFLGELDLGGDTPALCFIDECDAKPSEVWPYELLLPSMDAAAAAGAPVVYVFAGSSGSNLAGMRERMSSRPKGTDLLSRIPHDNMLSIAPLDIGDRLLVALGQLRTAAAETGRTISAVERMALFYVAVDPRLGSPRQLHELCVRAVERLLPGEVRLRYDHFFSPGNPENKAFWVRWQMHHRVLVGRFVNVDD